VRRALGIVFIGIIGCGSSEPDFCERFEESTRWDLVHADPYQARAIKGTITIGNGGAVLRDDRALHSILVDRSSLQSVILEARRNGRRVAAVRLRPPEQEGTFPIESLQGELHYCTIEGTTLAGYNGFLGPCSVESEPSAEKPAATKTRLKGDIVVRSKPAVERDDGRDYAFSFRINAEGEEGSIVDLDVVSFQSYGVEYGKQCGEGE